MMTRVSKGEGAQRDHSEVGKGIKEEKDKRESKKKETWYGKQNNTPFKRRPCPNTQNK